MRCVDTAALLQAWEQRQGCSCARRALLLLAVSEPELPMETLASWTIGRRDARLLALREQLFGTTIDALATCPGCEKILEVSCSTGELRVPNARQTNERVKVEIDGVCAECRIPTTNDLVRLENLSTQADGRVALLESCLISATLGGRAIPAGELPDDAVKAIGLGIEQADAELRLEFPLACPDCGYEWNAPLDLVGYVWSEVERWAQRLLRDVHCLASAYGWREGDILSLSPARRLEYLNLISA